MYQSFINNVFVLYIFADPEEGVVIEVTETDVISLHQNLDAMKDIIAVEINALCKQEPNLCCTINNTAW